MKESGLPHNFKKVHSYSNTRDGYLMIESESVSIIISVERIMFAFTKMDTTIS